VDGILGVVSAPRLAGRGGANQPPVPSRNPCVGLTNPRRLPASYPLFPSLPLRPHASSSLVVSIPYLRFLSNCCSLATATRYIHLRFLLSHHPASRLLFPRPKPPSAENPPLTSRSLTSALFAFTVTTTATIHTADRQFAAHARIPLPNYRQFSLSTCCALSVLTNPCAYTPAPSRHIVMYSR
jgi:hypothetical protein